MKLTRKLVLTGVFSAIAFILMLLEFPIAFVIPDFIKFDFSELPALICGFSAGPVWGIAVCLIKNLLHLSATNTGGVGELANFIIGASFVGTACSVYGLKRKKSFALLGMITGAVISACISFPINKFITYPFYMNFMNEEAILGAYRVFIPSLKNLDHALLIFNLPFTFFKFIINSVITFAVYKRISFIIKGKNEG